MEQGKNKKWKQMSKEEKKEDIIEGIQWLIIGVLKIGAVVLIGFAIHNCSRHVHNNSCNILEDGGYPITLPIHSSDLSNDSSVFKLYHDYRKNHYFVSVETDSNEISQMSFRLQRTIIHYTDSTPYLQHNATWRYCLKKGDTVSGEYSFSWEAIHLFVPRGTQIIDINTTK